jgi:pimeloyl-ACP methyl ester carboxylesterase
VATLWPMRRATDGGSSTSARRATGLLAGPILAALVVATAGQAARPSTARPDIVRSATGPALKLGVADGGGLVLRLWRLKHPDRAATLRRLGSPALRGSSAQAVAGETPCGQTPGLLCSQVVVPLDRANVVPGTVSLHVERLPALGVPKGVMFLIAGGPGQGSARSFDLSTPDNADYFRFLFPGYTLVAYDDRGTGASGLLRCPSLEAASTTAQEQAAVAACADSLGPARDFYGTIDHAEDLDAVRAAIGADKAGLYGVSYGTKLALAYAYLHGDRVERLILDSVLPTDLPDPLFANVAHEIPGTVSTFCSTGICAGATKDYAGDVAAVANRLQAKPATGKVLLTNGTTRTERVAGEDVLGMLVDSDLNPGLASVLPAVMHEARLGDVQPLLRAYAIDSAGSQFDPADLSSALFAATDCHDGPFPWSANTPVADRPAIVKAAIGAMPAGSFGPFGSWAGTLGNATFCLNWPPPSGGVTYGNGTLPNVPVLAVNGGYDMRTPAASATAVAAMFPQGRTLIVPGVGHSVVGMDPSFCAPRSLRAWMLGSAIPAQCPVTKPLVAVAASFPPVRARGPRIPAGATQTLSLAARTIYEAEAIWVTTIGGSDSGSVPGLYSGKMVATSPRTFSLVRYSIAPGVELSGKIRYIKFGPPLQFDGVVTVSGANGAHGLLGVNGDKVAGTLDGQLVGG